MNARIAPYAAGLAAILATVGPIAYADESREHEPHTEEGDVQPAGPVSVKVGGYQTTAYVYRGELLGESLGAQYLKMYNDGRVNLGEAGALIFGLDLNLPLMRGQLDVVPKVGYAIGLAHELLELEVLYAPRITVNGDPDEVHHEIEFIAALELEHVGVPLTPAVGFSAEPDKQGGYGFLRAGWAHNFEPVNLHAEFEVGVSGGHEEEFGLHRVSLQAGAEWRVQGMFHINAIVAVDYGARHHEWLPWAGAGFGMWE